MRYDKPSISAILEHYGATVPKRNGWFPMKCPFHGDTHASATANTNVNAFCCFACQYKGDGYAIIMAKEGVNFREAITIAEGILNARGEVLPQRVTRSGRISRRTRNNDESGAGSTLGRRLRPVNGT
jgi:DNA primase